MEYVEDLKPFRVQSIASDSLQYYTQDGKLTVCAHPCKIEPNDSVRDVLLKEFINGNGRGRPTGIMRAQSRDGIDFTADAIIEAVYKVRNSNPSWEFIANYTTVQGLMNLQTKHGQFMWQPSLNPKKPDTFMGYSIYRMPDYMPDNVLVFAQFDYAYVPIINDREKKYGGDIVNESCVQVFDLITDRSIYRG